jgi:hypothetical protein
VGLISLWTSNVISKQDQAEISATKSSMAKPPNFNELQECEKFSEDFKSRRRTFRRPKGQSALVPYIAALETRKKDPLAKETKITLETYSLLSLRGRSVLRAWCSACAAEVEPIAMEQTGVISNLDRAALEEWLNSEELHRLETADGSTQICLNSLIARVQKAKTS